MTIDVIKIIKLTTPTTWVSHLVYYGNLKYRYFQFLTNDVVKIIKLTTPTTWVSHLVY